MEENEEIHGENKIIFLIMHFVTILDQLQICNIRDSPSFRRIY